ncbi:MAG: translation elongation factor-like protein [bacterium]
MTEKKVGIVTHFFGKISVAIIDITDEPLAVGDTVHIKGHTTDLTQKIESMQIERQNIEKAEVGQSIGLKVSARVHEQDICYKVIE